MGLALKEAVDIVNEVTRLIGEGKKVAAVKFVRDYAWQLENGDAVEASELRTEKFKLQCEVDTLRGANKMLHGAIEAAALAIRNKDRVIEKLVEKL